MQVVKKEFHQGHLVQAGRIYRGILKRDDLAKLLEGAGYSKLPLSTETLGRIERGDRDLQAWELDALSKVLDLPLAFFEGSLSRRSEILLSKPTREEYERGADVPFVMSIPPERIAEVEGDRRLEDLSKRFAKAFAKELRSELGRTSQKKE